MTVVGGMLRLCLLLVILQPQLCSSGNCSQCNFYPHPDLSSARTKLQPFCEKRFSLEEPGKPFVKYTVGICTQLLSGKPTDAVLQSIQGGDSRIIGNLSRADVISGGDWVMLQYDGDDTTLGCRPRSIIMLTCNLQALETQTMKFLAERSNKSDGCYYMFQLEDASLCATYDEVTTSHLSAGSILCIIFFTFVSVYLVGGFIVQRFFRGAKGADQIPNLAFWKELGNLVADGCDFVCRCNRGRDSNMDDRGSRGLIENASDHVDIDDRLLGM